VATKSIHIGGSSYKPEFWDREAAEKAEIERQAYFDATGQTARMKHYEETGEILPAESFTDSEIRRVWDGGRFRPVSDNSRPFEGYSVPVRTSTQVTPEVAQRSGSGMSLADLFDNSKWETHEVAAAPKRGGEVERRRYIGGGGGQNVPVFDPSQSGTEVPEFISTGEAWIRNPDLLAERFRNRYTGGPVTLAPTDSLDKQDKLDIADSFGNAPEPAGPSWWERTGEKGMGYGADAWDAATGFAGDVNRKISEIDQTPAAAAAASTIGDFGDSFDPKWLQDLLRGKVDEYDNWLADRYRNVDDAARKSREIAEGLRHEFEAPEALTNTVGTNQVGTIATAGLGVYDYIKYLMGLKPGFHAEQFTVDKEY